MTSTPTTAKHFFKTAYTKSVSATLFCVTTIALLTGLKSAAQTITWKLDNPNAVGGYKPVVLGAPLVVHNAKDTSLSFNGINDGLIIPVNPVSNWPQFTVEVLFKPAADGPSAPRLLHFEDSADNRGTVEIRVTPQGQWYMDTFLKNGKTNGRLTLIDSAHLHPANQWYWVALVYDGKTMSHYVNGVKELEGPIMFSPMTTGQIALGVRLNKVNWFKGQMREIRFHPTALAAKELKHL